MDLDSCSVMTSVTPFPSIAPENAEDRMVEMELEAAEALADLAHLAARGENGVGAAETATNWGCKGKRVRKRVKSESQSPPPGHSGLNLTPFDPVLPCSDPADDPAELDQQQDETMCCNVLVKPVKAEQGAEPNSMCAPRGTSIGVGRSRQNLTEAEKEERRIRRILANRESARQTIRRRQALCEDLTRKATDLARENESLRREKELAFKEYESLETINKHLKALVAKAINSEVGESSGELKSANAEISTSPSANCPLLLYNHHPFSPIGCWPSIIQNLHSLQSGDRPQNPVIIPPSIPAAPAQKLDSSQVHENSININASRTPFYIVPCPWFVPLPDNENGSHTQHFGSLKNVQNETSRHNGYDSSSSSQGITNMENLLDRKAKNEVSGSTEARTTGDLNDFPVEFLPSRGGQKNGSCPREVTFTRAPLYSVGGTLTVEHENSKRSDYSCNTEAILMKAGTIMNAWPEKKQAAVNYPSKKLVDAVAAAEARKRRKELTKLKNLHGRQCRMHC